MKQLSKPIPVTILTIIFVGIVYVVTSKYMMHQMDSMKQNMIIIKKVLAEKRQAKLAEEQSLKEEAAMLKSEQIAQAQALANQKESIWFKWYKEPKGCTSLQSDENMVECVNHKTRARSEFDNLWDQGKIDATSP